MSSKKALLAGAILILCGGALDAQTYYDRQGAIVQGVATIPFDYAPLGPGQHNFAPTNTTPLTIPTGARYMRVCASTANVRYATDGRTTPTTSLGQPLIANSCLILSGVRVMANFRAACGSGTLDIEYFQ